MNNIVTFPRSLPWKRHSFPPLLTDRVDTYQRDLDACIEAQRLAMSALARMTKYDIDTETADVLATIAAMNADAHDKLKRVRHGCH